MKNKNVTQSEHFQNPFVETEKNSIPRPFNAIACYGYFNRHWRIATSLKRLPWSWSCVSWIFNYLCNQCPSPLMLWVRISINARCTALCDKVCQWLATGRCFS